MAFSCFTSHLLPILYHSDGVTNLQLHLTIVCMSGHLATGLLLHYVTSCVKPQRSQQNATTPYREVHSVCYILFIDTSHRLQ